MEVKSILVWYEFKTLVANTSRKEECGPVNKLLKRSTILRGNRLISKIRLAQMFKFYKLKLLMMQKRSVKKLDLNPIILPLNPLREVT
jgi:hypothetical protein